MLVDLVLVMSHSISSVFSAESTSVAEMFCSPVTSLLKRTEKSAIEVLVGFWLIAWKQWLGISLVYTRIRTSPEELVEHVTHSLRV